MLSILHPQDGTYFKVAGPAIVEPSVQRTPVIYQAG